MHGPSLMLDLNRSHAAVDPHEIALLQFGQQMTGVGDARLTTSGGAKLPDDAEMGARFEVVRQLDEANAGRFRYDFDEGAIAEKFHRLKQYS